MKNFQGMRFTEEHEWVREEKGLMYVGITNYAQLELGDIVYVELPEPGNEIEAGDQIGVVESVKTAADIYSPVSGVIREVNDALTDAPELLNSEPYENWIAAIEATDPSELDKLMNEDQYGEFCTKGA